MDKDLNDFIISYNGVNIQVQRRALSSGPVIFRVNFPDRRQSLVLTRATGTEIGRHWTSIPEGRLQEAADIGELIEAYFK